MVDLLFKKQSRQQNCNVQILKTKNKMIFSQTKMSWTVRWAWFWSGGQWDWIQGILGPEPDSRRLWAPLGPWRLILKMHVNTWIMNQKTKILKLQSGLLNCLRFKELHMKDAYLDWLTSIKDPIFEVVNEMCSSPMTISSSL